MRPATVPCVFTQAVLVDFGWKLKIQSRKKTRRSMEAERLVQVTLMGSVYPLRLFNNPIPARPNPRRMRVEGSGTGVISTGFEVIRAANMAVVS